MESKYQATYASMQEIVWLWGVLTELDLWLSKPTPFLLGSQSAENNALNPVYHKRSTLIEIVHYWVREHVDIDGEFRTARLVHVRTGEQIADIFTKALTGLDFETHRKGTFGTERKSSAFARDSERKRTPPNKLISGSFFIHPGISYIRESHTISLNESVDKCSK